MSNKTKLLTHSQSHKKAIINLEIASKVLDKRTLNNLNQVLIELNHIQETLPKEETK
jgi:hypothetical protein